MGCGQSKPPTHRANISAPSGGLELVPPPRRDKSGVPISVTHYDLDRVHLQRALHYAASYLHQQRADIVITAIGGAVNTILLRTRETTHDIDFFIPNDSSRQAKLLDQASQKAEAQSSLQLGRDWLNNATSLYISRRLRQELTQEAIVQNEVVFREPGLTVLAAPWIYALCAKLERIGNPGKRREYDPLDAATYLHRYNHTRQGRPIRYQVLLERASHYGTTMTAEGCRDVNGAYESRYRSEGISF